MRIGTLKSYLFSIAIVSTNILCASALAAPFTGFPGSVPLKFENQAASDLVFNGKKLLPDEARKLFETGKIKDLTDLDPAADSDIWKNEFPKGPLDSQDAMGINSNFEEFDYISETEVPNGRMGIIVSKKMPSGESKAFQILLDVKAHNILLRKNLLRKIGYKIPPTAHLKKFKLNFKGAFSKKEFVREILRKTFIEPERWVVEGQNEDTSDVVLQDAVIFDGANDFMYNIARGDMPAAIIQGRRLFNSLLVPYNLTDSPESVNVFPWVPGRIFNDQLILQFEDSEEFSTSFEDARWITRRILKLTRTDFEEIVKWSSFPDEVGRLIVEKLIARRNFLRENLKLTTDAIEIPVNSKISLGTRLVNGKLKGGAWPGFASEFNSQDPDAPLSGEETWGLFKSKFLTNVISNLMFEFNTRYVPTTDLAWKIYDHQLDVAAHQLAQFILTGKMEKVPFGFWSTDVYNGNLIAAREIVAGNYLGSDNIVQIADTIGASVDYGLYIGADGLPTKVSFSGQAKAFLVRTYTHLKPIKSIKAALKEPFRNMVVTWLKSKMANPIDAVIELEKKRTELGEEEFQKQVSELMKDFKDKLGIGESLIVQTSIGPNLNLRVGYGLAKDLDVYMKFQEKLTKISRLHIYRKDENTIQVYRDPALFNVMDLSFGLNTKIHLLELGWSWTKGMARTEFFQVNVNPDVNENPDLFLNLNAVRRALRHSRVDQLRRIQKPWFIDHDFSEKGFHFDFLFFRSQKTNLLDEMKIKHPNGAVKEFVRKTIGKRSGHDYESVTLDVLNALVDEYMDKDLNVNLVSSSAGNPGDTFKGKSFSRQITLEGEVASQGSQKQIDFSEALLSIDYRWKGWDISQKKAQEILDDLNEKYGSKLFPQYSLNETKKIQFYSIDVSIALYQEAVDTMVSFNEAKFRAIYNKFAARKNLSKEFVEAHIRQYVGYVNKIREYSAKGKTNDVADKVAKLVNLLESILNFEGFKYVVGGEQNLFVKGSVHGFRVGDENGDNDVFSHTLGQIGSEMPSGKLRQVQRQIGISEGEMFIYWLLNRL